MEGEQYVEYAVMLGMSGVEQIEENSSQITGKRKDFSINFNEENNFARNYKQFITNPHILKKE